MGRVNDKEGLLSEADSEIEKGFSDKESSDALDKSLRKKYKCTEPGCTAKFLRPSRLTWHLRKHNDKRPYKCRVEGCTKAYTNSSHLKRHENSHNPVTMTYTCKQCLLEVGSLFSLKRHYKMIHDPKRLTCEECGAKFRKKHCYNEHMSMHGGTSIYECDVCRSTFPTLRLIKRHRAIHDKPKTYPCKSPGCSQVFDKWSKLGKHMENDHEFDHKCDKCEKTFKLKCQLVAHAAVHVDENIFLPCPFKNCPRFYVHRRNLKVHVDTYHRGRRFYCDMCNERLTTKASIVRHIRLCHQPTKPLENKTSKPRKPRKDSGVPKTSMAVRLAGINVPHELQKNILTRIPKIVLKRIDAGAEHAKHDRSIPVEETETIFNNDSLDQPTIGRNLVARDFVPVEEKNNAETPLSDYSVPENRETNVENDFCLPQSTDEQLLSVADNLLKSGKLVVLENDSEELSDTAERHNDEIMLLADKLLRNDDV